MKKILLLAPLTVLLTGCFEPSPEDLAKDPQKLMGVLMECALKGQEAKDDQLCINAMKAKRIR